MKKRKIFCLILAAVLVLAAVLAGLKWDTIFQRGNPFPYLAAMSQLSGENTFAAVKGMDGVYVTRRGDKEGLFRMIQDVYAVELQDQLGSSYLFSDGETHYMVGSEIYWSRFTVWMLPFEMEA